MKKLICLLLAVLLLSGCTLRNRQSSEDFIPETPVVHTVPPETADTTPTQPIAAPVTDGVTEIFNATGTHTDDQGTTVRYVFRMPLIDLPGDGAAACNREIDANVRPVIADQLDRIDRGEPLTVDTVDYEYWIVGGILTLQLVQHSLDEDTVEGETRTTWYSLRTNGAAASRADVLAEADLEETDYLRLLEETVRDWFAEKYQDAPLGYTAWLERTVKALDQSRMHLNPDGRPAVLVQIHDPDGAVFWQEFTL